VGKLILIVGLPGSGKGTLIAFLRKEFPEVVFPSSWTTRPPRQGEVEGEGYHFVSKEEFAKAILEGIFLEWVSIDGGHQYGTLKKAIQEPVKEGKVVLREVEVEGAHRLLALFPKKNVITIFINTDSWEVLKARMLARAPMAKEEILARQRRYEREVAFKVEADYVIENPEGQLEEAKKNLATLVGSLIKGN